MGLIGSVCNQQEKRFHQSFCQSLLAVLIEQCTAQGEQRPPQAGRSTHTQQGELQQVLIEAAFMINSLEPFLLAYLLLLSCRGHTQIRGDVPAASFSEEQTHSPPQPPQRTVSPRQQNRTERSRYCSPVFNVSLDRAELPSPPPSPPTPLLQGGRGASSRYK